MHGARVPDPGTWGQIAAETGPVLLNTLLCPAGLMEPGATVHPSGGPRWRFSPTKPLGPFHSPPWCQKQKATKEFLPKGQADFEK